MSVVFENAHMFMWHLRFVIFKIALSWCNVVMHGTCISMSQFCTYTFPMISVLSVVVYCGLPLIWLLVKPVTWP